jgi:3-oxoacyl-[acyl-carrier protein] reductase
LSSRAAGPASAATAAAFAATGVRVIVLGRRGDVLRSAAEAINAHVGRDAVETLAADVSNPARVEQLANELCALSGGSVDVLVNNAGGLSGEDGSGLAALAHRWENDFRTNLLSAVLLTSALIDMITAPGGRIVNVSSIAALRPGGDSYGAAKAGIIGWTYSLAGELVM